MYVPFFRLAQAPFSIAPDPRYLFMSERHREALAHLLYGADSGGGIVLLTGEIGAGKTTICRCFLEQVPANCNVAYIFNPKLTVHELLESICEEFHIALPDNDARHASLKDCIDALNKFLLEAHAAGRNSVLIIDEAQNLSADVLEQLRLLTNLETNERKLLQIILIGQPELRDMLARPELEQLAQRVIARYHLDSLSEAETGAYIAHRLVTAGLQTASPFPPAVLKHVHRLTQGVPRRINLLCDRALLGAYAQGAQQVNRQIVTQAANELFGEPEHARTARSWKMTALATSCVALIAATAAWTMTDPKLRDTVLVRLLDAMPQQHGARKTVSTTGGAAPKPAVPVGTTVPVAAANLALAAAPKLDATQAPAMPPAAQDGKRETAAGELFTAADGATPRAARNEQVALHELARFWGAKLGEGDPCELGAKTGLRCYHGSKGFAELRLLDRPVVLELTDAAGKNRYLLLTGLTETTATLRTGDASETVNLLALTRHASGQFTTFWRPPVGFEMPVRFGESGPQVDWIADQLAKLNGEAKPAAGQPFERKMLRQLREFQTAQGLFADGIAGPVTLMHLSRLAGLQEPALSTQAVAQRQTRAGE